MDGTRFDQVVKQYAGTPQTRSAMLRGVWAAALGAGLAIIGAVPPVVGKKKGKKKPVCLCATADASGCTTRKVKKKQARKLARQACNYRGKCQPGVVGTQCLCPTGQTRCGQTCVNLQRDAANCGACGTTCAAGVPCVAGSCCAGLLPSDDLQAAIAAAAPGATLRLCAGTWFLSSTLGISKNLTLVGAGVGQTILDGNNAVRVLAIASTADVTLRDLTITKGRASGANPNDRGGGVFTEGTLRLAGVAVTGNSASGIAGGIFNSGTLTLQGASRVTGNSADRAGGIYSNGTLTLEGSSRVTGNSAESNAGGIYNVGGTLTLRDDSLVGGDTPEAANRASDGGGIFTTGDSVILLDRSRVTGNTATTSGGGIFNVDGTVTLHAGSGVTGNSADSAGGIYNDSGTVTVAAGALVCNNTPTNSQCGGPTAISGCPNPPGGICED